jgi:hypothetical protein
MNGRRPAAKSARSAKPAGRMTKADVHAASPYGYAHTDWLAARIRVRQARQP